MSEPPFDFMPGHYPECEGWESEGPNWCRQWVFAKLVIFFITEMTLTTLRYWINQFIGIN
jgi:hypothetical protein